MWRFSNRDPQDEIEPEEIGHVPGNRDMPGMRRVERAPEEPDAGRPGLRQGPETSARSCDAESESGYSRSSLFMASSARSSYPIASFAR